MELTVYNTEGQEVEKIELPEKVFGLKVNNNLVKQAYEAQMSQARIPYAHAKDRSEVRGGGKKPWRQKGTGRARHGSIRSPLWRGGGVTHGPRKEKVYAKDINKKMKRAALLMVLS
ncbi:MAG: 50S ribosomal protein L4, partial [bacterium]